ncbi:MAG: hypothetical protein GC159_13075 [Phycisphaera sp.]|nr:hypothetical protein [Phycisphaera sp.]
MSIATDIADAVTTELNASGLLPVGVTALRMVLPEFELADLAELKVAVVPKSVLITGSTRAASQYDIAVDIGVQKKLAPGNKDLDTEVATLGTLVDQIADHLRRRTLSGAPYATWVSIANEPVYAPEHLAEQRVFTSVLTITYRAIK